MSVNAETIDSRENLTIKTGVIVSFRHFCYRVTKRTFDIVFAATGLIAGLPLFLIVAIAIKLTSKGPVFFRQNRTGKDGKEFDILKFRSMAVDNDVRDFSTKDQYTSVGKFIRRTSIDELPQLINIVKGEMSFIGPRPWIPEYWENMNEEERGRCLVRPGITGLAQAKGRNNITIFDKIGYDLEYVRNASIWLDIVVIFLTIKVAIYGGNANCGKAGIKDELDCLKRRKVNG